MDRPPGILAGEEQDMTHEKRELTAAQIDAITSTPAEPHNLDARAWCRAAIAAHEALNADAGVMREALLNAMDTLRLCADWADPERRVTISEAPINWLKKHYPALCEKSGLCERIAGRLYTKVFLEHRKPDNRLAELRAKVEGLPGLYSQAGQSDGWLQRAAVLAEIDKAMGEQR